MPSEEWTVAEHVSRYLNRADEFPHRAEGENVLLEHVPLDARRVLDLGTGDGRLLALLQADRPGMLGVGVDFSDLMLGRARERFEGDERVELVKHDLTEPLPDLGRFDAVVSSFVIHHLEHERKRSLYAEVFDLLESLRLFERWLTEDLDPRFAPGRADRGHRCAARPPRSRPRKLLLAASRHVARVFSW